MGPVEIREVPALPTATVRGHSAPADIPKTLGVLFDQFYAGFKGKGGLNIALYSRLNAAGEFDIECGVQVESGGNSSTPAGRVATIVHVGPYERMKPAHEEIHRWVREHGHKLAGPSWEVYGHWNEDPAKLRTDIFYLLAE
jgi:effector-binding domain-containing protein